jgi:hypothetical protein
MLYCELIAETMKLFGNSAYGKTVTNIGICGVVGRATACVCGDAGSIPTGGALEVWPWTLGSKTAWLVNKSAGRPPFKEKFISTSYGNEDNISKKINSPHFKDL